MEPDRMTITGALCRIMPDADAAIIANVLCTPAKQVTVIDDDACAALDDDGTRSYAEKTPAQKLVDDVFRSTPMMVALPARMYHMPCFSQRIRDRLGPVMANKAAAAFSDAHGAPVREALVLAMALEYAYGRDGLAARIDSWIFSKPEYAAAAADARPLAVRCTNAN